MSIVYKKTLGFVITEPTQGQHRHSTFIFRHSYLYEAVALACLVDPFDLPLPLCPFIQRGPIEIFLIVVQTGVDPVVV